MLQITEGGKFWITFILKSYILKSRAIESDDEGVSVGGRRISNLSYAEDEHKKDKDHDSKQKQRNTKS